MNGLQNEIVAGKALSSKNGGTVLSAETNQVLSADAKNGNHVAPDLPQLSHFVSSAVWEVREFT